MTRPLAVLAAVAFTLALIVSAVALGTYEPKGADEFYRQRVVCQAVCR